MPPSARQPPDAVPMGSGDGMKAAALSKADADRVWEPVKKAGTQAVDTVGKELAAELKKPHETTITIYKRVVEKRQSGGLIGASSSFTSLASIKARSVSKFCSSSGAS